MSDEYQIENTASEDVLIATPHTGQDLSAARENQGMSVADVARNLKIAVRQVEALESGDYSALPGITFVKGFIRNYAKLLQIDPEPLLVNVQHVMPGATFQAIISPNERIEISTAGSKSWVWLALLLMVLIVAVPLLIYEKLHSDARVLLPSGKPVAPLPPLVINAAPAGASEGVLPPSLAPESVPVGLSDASVKAEPVAAATEVVVAHPVAVSGTGSVKMNFSKDAWVEVRDKSGNKIFSQLNRAGSEQTVQGNPPLSIVAGNAANVSITYNGKPVDLVPYINVDVARLTLE